ncbi:MAG: hypothetical protein HRT73_09155 [Flavobacteriales bacterium]|nr:hypothetical protein [Flavobacteriales bacterium]NRA92577.1 hypothetical protein [Psychroserpens sp.]
MDVFKLSRTWFEFCFNNPDKIKPSHSAIYFFAIEHCNRLGWKDKFGFPSQMVMEAVGIKNWRTYSKALSELVEFGFIEMIEVSKNQYSSNIIAIVKNTEASTKALDKALQKHSQKQSNSTVGINIQETKLQETNIQACEIEKRKSEIEETPWLDSELFFAFLEIRKKLGVNESIMDYSVTLLLRELHNEKLVANEALKLAVKQNSKSFDWAIAKAKIQSQTAGLSTRP